MVVLLLASILPINSSGTVLNSNYSLNIRLDYVCHALIYLPLPRLLFSSISKKIKSVAKIILIALAIAMGLEVVQMLLPYRAFNINDLAANVIGVFIGFFSVKREHFKAKIER